MQVVELATKDRPEIGAFLREDAAAHVYALADLDDFFWPDTTWFGAREGGALRAVTFLLGKLDIPVLYAVCAPGDAATRWLLEQLRPRLPARFFVNLGLGLEAVFAEDHAYEPEGIFAKYALADARPSRAADVAQVERIGANQHGELRAFYAREAYTPAEQTGRFLAPYMYERWPFCGIRESGRLVCAGGVHVLSERERVAALGNVATRPDRRGRGLARAVTAWLCRELEGRVDQLGLNVLETNTAAVRCYEQLGFTRVRRYGEGTFTRRQ